MIIIDKIQKNIQDENIEAQINQKNITSSKLTNKQNAMLANIKGVSVQIKDINQMINSDNTHLISFAQKLQNCFEENEYITIPNTTNVNKTLIIAILSEDWLINSEYIESKTTEELKNICKLIETSIYALQLVSKEDENYLFATKRTKQLQYKLSTIQEVLLKQQSNNIVVKKVVKK